MDRADPGLSGRKSSGLVEFGEVAKLDEGPFCLSEVRGRLGLGVDMVVPRV